MSAAWKWPWGALALTAVLSLAVRFPVPEAWWLFPWILSLIFIGLPHGALDHEVILRLWRPQPPPRWALAAAIAGYLLLAALVVMGWFLNPIAIFVCFILLTWAHWGLGDLWWSWHRDPAYFTSGFHRVIFALWRGSLPMFLPLVIAPHIYREVATSICQLFSPSIGDLSGIDAISFRGIVLCCVLSLGLFEFAMANRRSGTFLTNASEGVILFAAFFALPPLVSVGFYFVFWHGLRHVLRLMKGEQLSLGQFVARSAPATVSALILLSFLAWEVMRDHQHPKFLGVYLALISALTFPHSIVVLWMDRREKIY